MGLKPMDDAKIVQLYWERNERAIPATSEKYGRYCDSIARNILGSREDAEECVNDTYLSAWNSMPPHRPDILSAFLGKLTRNLSIKRYRRNTAGKRGGGEFRWSWTRWRSSCPARTAWNRKLTAGSSSGPSTHFWALSRRTRGGYSCAATGILTASPPLRPIGG